MMNEYPKYKKYEDRVRCEVLIRIRIDELNGKTGEGREGGRS